MASNEAKNAESATQLQSAIQARKAELEAQIKALESTNIDKLLQERELVAAKLADIDARIAEVSQQLGLKTPRGAKRAGADGPARTRMSSLEIRNRILKALAEEKHGMSQKTISERTSIPYGTVAAYMKTNAATFKTTGQLKGKKYFLK